MAILLGGLRAADAEQQVTVLLARDPAARVSLDDPFGVTILLGRLREAGAHEQAAALAARLSAAGMFGLFLEEDERGPPPAGELGPDLPAGLGDGRGRAGSGDDGQVARLRPCGQPHAQMGSE